MSRAIIDGGCSWNRDLRGLQVFDNLGALAFTIAEQRCPEHHLIPKLAVEIADRLGVVKLSPEEPRFMYQLCDTENVPFEPGASVHPAGDVRDGSCFGFDTLDDMLEGNREFPEFCAWLRQAELGESITTGGGAGTRITTWRIA